MAQLGDRIDEVYEQQQQLQQQQLLQQQVAQGVGGWVVKLCQVTMCWT
jgi:hypothetical protein